MSDSDAELLRRYRWRNPRTEAEPMAFTFAEFVRGAFATWGWFLLFALPALVVTSAVPAVFAVGPGTGGWGPWWGWALLYLVYGIPIVLVVSLVALAVGSPGAWLLGWCLRRSDRIRVHVIAFAGYGVAFGVMFAWSLGWMLSGRTGLDTVVFRSPFIAASGAAAALGRYRAIVRTRPKPFTPPGEDIPEE
ncbi:hypothetical protein [Agromyces larvae]|uniref:Uncharacterized protein n=1 Tax=Agromyces larvae TaxID=2929802 RepID=A0ABY4C1F6_9MICO|nr:hypothetical protein [Agromyces larvae]UOE45262.1 hypothetical protein MTO99_05710 [Agromyces larvae]